MGLLCIVFFPWLECCYCRICEIQYHGCFRWLHVSTNILICLLHNFPHLLKPFHVLGKCHAEGFSWGRIWPPDWIQRIFFPSESFGAQTGDLSNSANSFTFTYILYFSFFFVLDRCNTFISSLDLGEGVITRSPALWWSSHQVHCSEWDY